MTLTPERVRQLLQEGLKLRSEIEERVARMKVPTMEQRKAIMK